MLRCGRTGEVHAQALPGRETPDAPAHHARTGPERAHIAASTLPLIMNGCMAQSVDGMNNVEWSRQEWPFPYITAKDVFTSDFYRCLALEFDLLLQRGLTFVRQAHQPKKRSL